MLGFRTKPDPKLMLYSVGINAYQRSPLRGCVRDSNNMVEYLSKKGFETHQLLDGDATLGNWQEFWIGAIARVSWRDMLVLHYSGHGSEGPGDEPDQTDECLVSVDMLPFWDNQVGAILSRVNRRGQVFVVLDCCHSQTGTRFLSTEAASFQQDAYRSSKSIPFEFLDPAGAGGASQVRGLLSTRAVAKSTIYPVVEFAACESNDVTYDAQINGVVQGCYTRAFLDAAGELDAATNSFIRPGYNSGHLQLAVRTKLPSREYPNKPQLLATKTQEHWRMWVPNQSR